jgi:hypothetical protein
MDAKLKLYELVGDSATGRNKAKVRATSAAQAMGIMDAKLSDQRSAPVRDWTATEIKTACFTHEGCDGLPATCATIDEL